VSLYLGVDIGGTNVKIATVSAAGRVLARGVIETRAGEGPAPTFRRIHDAARTLVGRGRIAGVGVGCAGLLDARSKRLLASPNLPGWQGAALERIARAHFGVPILVENDANSAAFGESFARGRNGRNLVMITLGTGVGGGIVSDGRLVRGTSGYAGEVGHMIVDPDGPRCHCGSRGCLEAYAGAYGIERTARVALRRRGRERLPGGGRLDARAVFEAARRGNPAARETVRVTGEHLGTAIASLLNLLNPSMVVIGGGIAASFDALSPHVRRAVKRSAFAATVRAARIEPSRLGNDAAVVGAAMLVAGARPRRRPAG
jgi:glucokinase